MQKKPMKNSVKLPSIKNLPPEIHNGVKWRLHAMQRRGFAYHSLSGSEHVVFFFLRLDQKVKVNLTYFP